MSETIRIGDLTVRRLLRCHAFARRFRMGEPSDPARARVVPRRVVDLGIDFVDTAWYYRSHVANRLIAEPEPRIHPSPPTSSDAVTLR